MYWVEWTDKYGRFRFKTGSNRTIQSLVNFVLADNGTGIIIGGM